jgi:hypothetical protein
MTDTSAPRARTANRVYVHEELVPLAEACAAAYHLLIQGQKTAHPQEVEEARGLIAIALSRVATLYRMTDGAISPLSGDKVHQALFSGDPDLRDLYIRRGALLEALETLKALCLL